MGVQVKYVMGSIVCPVEGCFNIAGDIDRLVINGKFASYIYIYSQHMVFDVSEPAPLSE